MRIFISTLTICNTLLTPVKQVDQAGSSRESEPAAERQRQRDRGQRDRDRHTDRGSNRDREMETETEGQRDRGTETEGPSEKVVRWNQQDLGLGHQFNCRVWRDLGEAETSGQN